MSSGPNSDDFELAKSTSHLLHRAQQLAADRFAIMVGENGVTLRQFAVLSAIHESPGLSQTELVHATGIDRSTLADMIVRMEKRGWVHRAASNADARANSVTLTDLGRGEREKAVKPALAADAAILDALKGQHRRAQFTETLVKLAQASDAAEAKAKKKAEKEAKKAARRQARLEASAKEKAERDRKRREAKAHAAASEKHKRKKQHAESKRKNAPKNTSKGKHRKDESPPIAAAKDEAKPKGKRATDAAKGHPIKIPPNKA